MRFWRIKIWWHAYVMGRRVFYAEGYCDTILAASRWRVFSIVPRSLGLQATREWREMIEQMEGKVTREVVR